ncbi:hypothetical protein Tco_0217430 [Tanacetum coccineum]
MFRLHELDELRHQAYENSRLYKARTKVIYRSENYGNVQRQALAAIPNYALGSAHAATGMLCVLYKPIVLRLELLNQEVSIGIKTRTSVEVQAKLLEKAGNESKKAASGKPNRTWEDHSGRN